MDHIAFLVLGSGNGAVFAALALALVVTYRSSGVLNFATGAIALYIAYTYALLRRGELLIPVPGLPSTVHLGFTPEFPLALALSLLIAAGFGALLYVVVFRPLRSAPAVAKAVASIGVMVVLQALLAQKVGTTPITTPHIFPLDTVAIGGINVSQQILYLAATVVIVTVILWVGFRFTRFGLATRAAAETEKGALVTGLSADRIALANWAISAVVAGLSGILIAPIAPIIPISYTLYVVPALAAALVAGFTSLPIAVIAGLLIGAVNSELGHLQAQHQISWLTADALGTLVPLVLIIGYLVVRGRPLPSRGALVLRTLGRAPRPRSLLAPTVVGGAAGLAALFATSGGDRGAVTRTIILAIIALSMVVVTGYAGQISLAQVTLAGVGAFALNRLTMNMGVPFPAAPILAALVATVIGVVVGLPALRVRGLPVAVVTFALAVSLDAFWFRNTDLINNNNTTVTSAKLFGINLAVGAGTDQNRIQFGVMCLMVLIAVALGVAWLRRSRWGAAMLAVRANERSAAAAGIAVAHTKVIAFAIGSFIAGLGGALLAYQQTRANESQFSPLFGLGLFASAYLAGITSITGGILAGVLAAGGVLYTVLSNNFQLGTWYEVATGALLVVTVIRNPEGIAAGLHGVANRLRGASGVGSNGWIATMSPVATASASRHSSTPFVGGESLLTVEHISVRYGGVTAVDDVSFSVPKGAIVGLIGPNGAGKTTLIDAISGFAIAHGSVQLAGESIDRLKPHVRVRHGLGRTFQGIELYEDLTVGENIVVGEHAARLRDGAPDASAVDELCALLGLEDVVDRPVSELSQGQRQLVSVARALAGRPKVVLLDEPAGGLDSTESEWLGDRLRSVRDAGITVVMIDHDMHLVLNLCDVIHVLDVGQLIASGTPDEIRANAAVTAAYLGDTHVGKEVR